MKLIYINKIGQDWKGNFVYEFLFSDAKLEDIDGEGWDSYPSSGNPDAPEGFIKETASLLCKLKLDLVQESDSFGMFDAVDGVIAMAWENMEGYDEYPEGRLHFAFGEDKQSVEDKLYEKDMVLKYDKELIDL
jgi:hypothetical protein|tara:strand:- start:151 stop:549 length:399 start_codon:yes stop_codon:yes gene_type:complete